MIDKYRITMPLIAPEVEHSGRNGHYYNSVTPYKAVREALAFLRKNYGDRANVLDISKFGADDAPVERFVYIPDQDVCLLLPNPVA